MQKNLRQLLLASPLGHKRIMALDPGFRSGCKVVCLDEQGTFLKYNTIFPHAPQNDWNGATQTIKELVAKYDIDAIGYGNGTASKETEQLVRGIDFGKTVAVFMVNESGASIYSASDVAREEFPDKDITVRGAVSIGRRLMDPLAELVKIDPKSIGVGQYQHDVDQNQLQASLDDTVISCVNSIGVELNTASKQILAYISGLGPQLAQNIVEYRNKNGAFKRRSELRQIPRLGDKAFEQAAGFLRIRNAEHPLDSSAVHPERYGLVEQMAKDLNCKVEDLMKDEQLRQKIKLQNYVSETVGLPTLNDILKELAKPGRDPRSPIEEFRFAEGVSTMEDLKPGMKIPAIITNVTNFGAFADVGVKQDGLIHISHLANRFISDPNEAVKLGQKVMATVLEVDIARKRIALSLKDGGERPEVRGQKTEAGGLKPTAINRMAEPMNPFQAKLAELKKNFKN